MKKTLQMALMGAIALTGAVGMTGCSSDEETVNNPNYNPATNEVLAKFMFNVSTGNGGTRQSAGPTQATESELFRGIDNAFMYSFKQTADGRHLAAATTADKHYDLAQVLAPYSVSSENSRRIIETSLPLNTNTLLFYGRAVEGNATGYAYPAYDVFGHLDDFTLPVDNDVNGVTITLGQRVTGDNLTKYRQIENLLSAILTALMNTNMAGDNHVAISASGKPLDEDDMAPYGFDVSTADYPADLSWASYANADGKSPVEPTIDLYPLEKKLADIYREMTTIKNNLGEVRAGSGYALRLTVHDLWTSINEVRCATPLNKSEAVAKYLAHRITVRLKKYFGVTYLPSDGGAVEGVTFRDPLAIIAELATDEWPATADAKPSDFSTITNADRLNDFPGFFDMPFGAAHLSFDTSKKQFAYVKNFNTSAMAGEAVTIESYCYPSELLYFGNSPVRVSNDDKKTDGYPKTVADWDNDLKWTSDWTKNSHVTSSTQGVAMQNDINYGTALLRTTVHYGADVLKDNNHNIQKGKVPTLADSDEPDKQITVDGTTFQLTGVIVGGMAKTVGWNYLAKAGETYSTWVYDHAIASAAIPASGSSAPNYTLLFDNYRDLEHQDKVYVALEFINKSGEDFFGEHGMIRKDSHFYLIGELDPEKSGLNAITWPTHHPLPPYNADGTSIKTPRVFMQDYMTSADFVIGANSLKHAYLTVPDLRYSSLTLGLSVDLKWSTGLNFGDVILGGN